jgi:ammonia channel protein AmtB
MLLVYVPIAYWVWGGGFRPPACSISPAAPWCI